MRPTARVRATRGKAAERGRRRCHKPQRSWRVCTLCRPILAAAARADSPHTVRGAGEWVQAVSSSGCAAMRGTACARWRAEQGYSHRPCHARQPDRQLHRPRHCGHRQNQNQTAAFVAFGCATPLACSAPCGDGGPLRWACLRATASVARPPPACGSAPPWRSCRSSRDTCRQAQSGTHGGRVMGTASASQVAGAVALGRH